MAESYRGSIFNCFQKPGSLRPSNLEVLIGRILILWEDSSYCLSHWLLASLLLYLKESYQIQEVAWCGGKGIGLG